MSPLLLGVYMDVVLDESKLLELNYGHCGMTVLQDEHTVA